MKGLSKYDKVPSPKTRSTTTSQECKPQIDKMRKKLARPTKNLVFFLHDGLNHPNMDVFQLLWRGIGWSIQQ